MSPRRLPPMTPEARWVREQLMIARRKVRQCMVLANQIDWGYDPDVRESMLEMLHELDEPVAEIGALLRSYDDDAGTS